MGADRLPYAMNSASMLLGIMSWITYDFFRTLKKAVLRLHMGSDKQPHGDPV